jgi:hypothetical protein
LYLLVKIFTSRQVAMIPPSHRRHNASPDSGDHWMPIVRDLPAAVVSGKATFSSSAMAGG